jgi:hypothetical protein
MNTFAKKLFALLGILPALALCGQTTAVLENFSESTAGMPAGTTTNGFSPGNCTFDGARGYCNTNIALFTAYGVRSPQSTITQYTATGPNDPFVTEGSNAMAITFYEQGFENDFQVVLDDTNSYLVEQAAVSGQIGRYILRYDMVFSNPGQYSYFNQDVYIGSGQDYLSIGGAVPFATNASLGVYSCALELPALGLPLPNTGTNIQMIFADNFGVTNAVFTNCTMYLGNIRLVDTYATTSTVPVVYPLFSLKNGIGMASNLYPTVTTYYGNNVTNRANLFLYVTNGLYNAATDAIANVCTTNFDMAYPNSQPDPHITDFAVSESDGAALEVSNNCYTTAGVGYEADFAISFAGTKLGQILSQNWLPAQLAHYTLRWDSTLPGEFSFFDGLYVNMTYATGAASLPMCQGRRENFGQVGLQRLTYSVTLDQIAAWGGSPIHDDPAIIFFSDPENIGSAQFYYFDNFELLDTAPVVPTITSSQYNPATRQFKLVWTSETGGSYTVQMATNLLSGFTPLVANIPSGGTFTTNTVTLSGGNVGFFRILAQ